MRTKPSQHNRTRPLIIVLLTILVFSFSIVLQVYAAVNNADFEAYAEDATIDVFRQMPYPASAL